MSLVHAAHHLAAQGRGEDTHLVHMTSKELAAMQKLAESQGKSLTINPKTGLPEAGILSSVLPMALGALAVGTGQVELLPYIAAGVGVADYAITGSLTQGLMAGLGTWSGGNLASGLAEAGAASTANVAAQEGGNQAAQEFAKQQAAAEATRLTAQETAQQTASEIAKSQIGNMTNLTTEQIAKMTGNLTDANAAEIVKAAGMANAGMGLPAASTAANMGAGITSGSAIGNTLMNNKMALAGVAAPFLMNSLTKQPTIAPAAAQQKNPFGMKEIPRDENGKPIFNAMLPAQPKPPYQAVYPNYVANPYNPISAASGGLMQDKNFTAGGMYPGSQIDHTQYSSSPQTPMSMQSTLAGYDPETNPLTGEPTTHMARGGAIRFDGGGQIDLHGSVNFNNGQNQAQSANGYTPAGGNPWGGGQFSQQGGLPPQGQYQRPMFGGLGGVGLEGLGVGGMPSQSARDAYMSQAGFPVGPQTTPNTPQQTAMLTAQGMASGGIASYKGSPDYGSMVEGIGEVEHGIEMATKRQALDDRQHPVEIAADEPELARLDPHNRARKLLEMLSSSSKVKLAKGLPQSNVLGAISTDPAQMIAEQRAKEAIAAEQPTEAKAGGLMAAGGRAHLGDYSDGGHLLKGPGDGVSDSIPATIGGKQPARLATGEFVIPARIVSELGNGSTDAGAKRLYAMMDRIKAKRAKTKNIAADTKAYKYLPA